MLYLECENLSAQSEQNLSEDKNTHLAGGAHWPPKDIPGFHMFANYKWVQNSSIAKLINGNALSNVRFKPKLNQFIYVNYTYIMFPEL